MKIFNIELLPFIILYEITFGQTDWAEMFVIFLLNAAVLYDFAGWWAVKDALIVRGG